MLGHVPPALRSLLVVVAFFAVAWALLVPPFQAPDEDVHLAYVQSLAERHELPPNTRTGPQLSAELSVALGLSNARDTIFHGNTKPTSGPAAEPQAEALLPGLRSDDGQAESNVSRNPPAAYGLLAAGYELTGGSIYDRLYGARLVSSLLVLVTTIGAWLLAGELFARRRSAQLLCAGTVGLWPMLTFVTSSVSVDGALCAEWSLVAWLGVRCVRRGLTPWPSLALGVLTGLALVTKATSLALLPAVLLVALVGVVEVWRRDRRTAVLALAALAVPLVLLQGGWLVLSHETGRAAYGQVRSEAGSAFSPAGFVSYLWQFYLPRCRSCRSSAP